MRNALKAVGAALAVIAICTPLIFWPAEPARPDSEVLARATVTVPPTVVVPTTADPSDTTTTTEPPTETEPIPEPTTTTTEPIRITVAAVGDVLPNESILEATRDAKTESYDFVSVFAPVAPFLEAADYTIANLETRLAGPEPGYSSHPLMNSPTELAYALKSAGVDMVTTASNYSLDMGWEGIVGTLDRLDGAGLAHVGTYRSSQERNTPMVVDIGGIRVGFLNYTAGLNGLTPPAEQAAYAVNTLDPDVVAEDAMMARSWGAEVVIAFLNYGEEYEREPNEEQSEVSQEILSRGVDVIVGSHPHVVQPIAHVVQYSRSRVTSKYVAYSLGNFLSNQRWRYSDSGLVAYVHIEKRGLRTVVTGVSYLPVYVQRSAVESVVRYRVLPVLPGGRARTDIPLTLPETERMAQVWEDLRQVVYRPDEGIVPLDPAALGL